MSEDAEQEETRRGSRKRGADEDVTQRIPTDDATQRIPVDDSTRQIPSEEQAGSRGSSGASGGRGRSRRSSDTEEFEAAAKTSARPAESRRARQTRSSAGGSGGRSEASSGYAGYSTGYNEVLREREEYLRDIYGGVDWLASFVGFIFTLLFAGLLGTGAALFVLVPLGLQGSLASGQLTSTAITGFAVIAAVAFFAFLFGGYISGRMARYDGGRNGAMVLMWAVLVVALLLVLSGVLGQVISGTPMGSVVGDALRFGATAVELIGGLGVSGLMISGGVLLAALLGGVAGGRLGSRYHREIDYTP